MAKETGEAAVKKIGVAKTILVHKYSVLKEDIWEMQRILDGPKKASLHKTFKNQAETNDKNENTKEALVLLATYYERLEAANEGIL